MFLYVHLFADISKFPFSHEKGKILPSFRSGLLALLSASLV